MFSQGVTVSPTFTAPTVDTAELAADFDSPATMTAVWGPGTTTGADRPMDCGTAKYNGVVIGAVQSSGDAATVPVLLYSGAKAGTTAITVTLDPASGVVKGVSCGGAPDLAAFPGVAPIAAYYGATAGADSSVVNDKTDPYFTPAFAQWRPADADYDKATCRQDGPDRWAVALTGATSASSTWDFAAEPVRTVAGPQAPGASVGFASSLAVDLGSTKISRVTCFRANPPKADSTHPADYARALMDYYRLAADQHSLGVDAKAAIQPLFVSTAAFTKAWSTTGAVPLMCTKQVPGSVAVADGSTPTASGALTTVHMVTWPDWHPGTPGQEASTFTVVLDKKTMKISSVACGK